MICYKELIKRLRAHKIKTDFGRFSPDICRKAADALETLLAERDAAVEDLVMAGDCKTCGNVTTWCMENPDCCKGYKWRGPQKGDGHGD